MNSEIQFRMLSAVYACLLPIARLLLRSGITYGQFDAVAKRAFVREAISEADSRGRPANTSRTAVKTGLSRKDVKKIREQLASSPSLQLDDSGSRWGPPARVLHAWHVDERFLDARGGPRDLQFQDDKNGFGALVRAVAGDVPPGAVRAELKRSGAVMELPEGVLRAVRRYYVPGDVDEKAITVISGMLFPMAAGIAHNTNPARASDGFIQRFALSDRIDSRIIPEFRKWSREKSTQFIESIDDWLAHAERTDSAEQSSGDAPVVGIGVFYYEGPSADQLIRGPAAD
jgi:hypothetical protein